MNTGMNTMKRGAWMVLLLALALPAWAADKGQDAMPKQAEMSMVVTGHIRIAADGNVRGMDLDREEKIPKGVSRLIRGAVPAWKFVPLAPEQGSADTNLAMSVRVAARPMPEDEGQYQLRMVSASFGDYKPSELPGKIQMGSPIYPEQAVRSNVSGTVYAILRIGHDGKVEEAFAEQVNLKVIDNKYQMSRLREMLARATLAAVKNWRFEPPKEGDLADDKFWVLRVPVDFAMNRENYKLPAYGQWDAYMPGPRQTAPWVSDDHFDDTNTGSDAFADDRMRPVGKGPQLLTSLQG